MAAVEAELLLCLVRVGGLRLLFEPRAVRSIEGVVSTWAAPDELVSIDLREALEVPAAARSQRPESLLVRTADGDLRLIVCEIEQIMRGRLRALYGLPLVLQSFGRRLGLRGVTQLPRGELAYLVDPADLGGALLARGSA